MLDAEHPTVVPAALAGARRRVALPGGVLTLEVAEATWALDRLCDFAARQNAKRGFLIVSRVLGRHTPCAAREMRASFQALAELLPTNLEGPVLFLGLAETAIALGQGVHRAYRVATRRDDTLFIHSTRQEMPMPVVARFDEPHSHASSHLIYAPSASDDRHQFASARTLVLVDDELSTGTTLVNLVRAIAPTFPRLQQIVVVALTDWSEPGRLEGLLPFAASRVTLLRGKLYWEPDPQFKAAQIAPSIAGQLGRLDQRRNFGRLGIREEPTGIERIADGLGLAQGCPVFIVGTGEFTYPPFLLGEVLEARGHDVVVQATSRSPVHLGGAIKSRLRFADNYGTAVPNFLYNSQESAHRVALVCHETPQGSVDPSLLATLGGSAVDFGAVS